MEPIAPKLKLKNISHLWNLDTPLPAQKDHSKTPIPQSLLPYSPLHSTIATVSPHRTFEDGKEAVVSDEGIPYAEHCGQWPTDRDRLGYERQLEKENNLRM